MESEIIRIFELNCRLEEAKPKIIAPSEDDDGNALRAVQIDTDERIQI